MAKRKGLPVLSNKGRKVQATTRASGLFTTGNRRNNNSPMGNLSYKYRATVYGEASPYEDYENDAFGIKGPSSHMLDKLADKAIAGTDRAQTKQAAWGGKCGSCGTLRSRNGHCFCN